MVTELTPQSPTEPTKERSAAVRFIAAAVVLLVLVGGAALAINVLQSDEAGMGTAAAMPADTAVFVHMDLGQLDDLRRLLDVFSGALADAGLEPGQDPLTAMDDELQREMGLGVADVLAWISDDVGAGLFEVPTDLTSLEPQFVIAAGVRDTAAADAFLDDLLAAFTRTEDVTFTTTTYRDVTIRVSDEGTFAATRAADTMLLGSGERALRRAIDAQLGDESLLTDPDFEATVAELPGDRLFTVYAAPRAFGDFIASMADPFGAGVPGVGDLGAQLDAVRGLAMSAAFTPAGMRLDFVEVLDPERAAEFDAIADAASSLSGSLLPELFPADTLVYFGIGQWDVSAAWEAMRTAFEEQIPGGDLDLALSQASLALGLDIERDIIGLLTGELGAALLPSTEGALAAGSGMELGLVGAVGVTDTGSALDVMRRLEGFLPVEATTVEVGDGTLWVVEEGGLDLVAFGAANGYVVVGTSSGEATGLFGDGAKLDGADKFREATGELPGGTIPFFYMDISGLLDAVDAPAEMQRDLAPLRGIAAGARSSESVVAATVLVLIDY